MSASTAILFNAISGVPGDLNDIINTTVESIVYDTTLMPAAFGAPIKLVSGKVATIESGDAASDFYGILTRSAPTTPAGISEGFGSTAPNPNTVAGVAVGGPAYVLVKCTIGTPVKGGAVYMRVTEVGPALVGDLEADADGANNVLLPSVVWAVSGKDAEDTSAVRIK